jgi:hypothetical protein
MAPRKSLWELVLLAQCVSLWIGESLGLIERACLKSVLRQGHSMALYCYRIPNGVPSGIELRDAADILPEATVVRHWTGSVALFSNRFRYELLRRGLGTWLDTDVYLLQPLDTASPYLIGEEEPGLLASGVLRLPPDSPMLPPLLALFEERTVPPWLPLRAKVPAYWRLWTTGRNPLALMPWGSAGPLAVTAVARAHGLLGVAVPADVFYPTRWQEADWLLDPAVQLRDVITSRTVSIHLYNECIKHFKDLPAPRGSFLARLQAEGADEAEACAAVVA